ncbi:PASTA domain-containing protein [Streptomyces sp. NRRL S-646]|uniref:PASTA domain-containing protein n=1 Tax=Streptomyces sp. NRRL S-646 TaxID=1463917 RepID=UPI00099BB6EA|nr:PASTA domain-containing protein [Streptomyces sp. NRRL S-646]
MTLRAFMQGAGKSAIRRIAVLLVFVLALSGCDRSTPLRVVKAVAAGVPSLAPFFDEGIGLGHDTVVGPQAVQGSLQQGDTPGLYGGTRKPTICDIKQLKEFLTDPRNHQKAQAWATALNITTDEIPGYLDRLTPVLLRHDTLVQNHDYKRGKAVPFDSLLETGIAVLVDEQGLPAVKCSCGNPLRPFTGDTNRISVKFQGGNKKWRGYERSAVVAVQPAPRKMQRLALVDVGDPALGIDRPVGTTGAHDKTFDTRRERAVPRLAGTTFGDASRRLAEAGLAVGYDGKARPPEDARVAASDPPAGSRLGFGAYVTLSVAEETSHGPTTPPPPSTSGPSTAPPSQPPSSRSSPAPPSSPSSPSSSGPGPTSSAPTSSAPPSSKAPPSSAPPRSTSTTTSAPTTSAPVTTSAPPPSKPVTSSAPPPSKPATSGAPPPSNPVTTSAPATSGPASSAPATSESASSGPASIAIT